MEKGRDLPDWYLDEPVLLITDEFYLNAFHDLSTTRQFGMGVGPIPWDKIIDYAGRAGLDEENTTGFVRIIRAMDNEYMRWIEENRKTGNE